MPICNSIVHGLPDGSKYPAANEMKWSERGVLRTAGTTVDSNSKAKSPSFFSCFPYFPQPLPPYTILAPFPYLCRP